MMERAGPGLLLLLLLAGCPGETAGSGQAGAIPGKGSHRVVAETGPDGTIRLRNTDVVPGGDAVPADQPSWSFALPSGWEHAPEGSGGLDVITDVTIRRVAEDGKKSKLKASLARVSPESAKARALAAAGSIEGLVGDPKHAGITDVLPKHAASYVPVQVAGIPCMRGPREATLGKKRLLGEQVLGAKDGLWLEVSYWLEAEDAAGQAASKEAFERVLATLRVE